MIYKLEPLLTYNLWGGQKLSKIYHKKTYIYGEAWIMSCLKDMNSPIKGKGTLKDVFNKNKDIVKKGYNGEFPLLIKLIDANDDLSIQVHPEAKTECWHILSSKPSKLYFGLKKNSSKKEISNILKKGDITKLLNHIDVKEGDSLLIKPGTIHAIGKHTFLIEIQRSADVTYRLYDFNRVDKNGKKRELHIDKALSVINYKKQIFPKTNKKGLIIHSSFFNVYKEKVSKENKYNADSKSFHAITVIAGKGEIVSKKQNIKLNTFDTIFIPSNEGLYKIKGKLDIIRVTL